MKVVWTEQAAAMLRAIEVFVARDDPAAAVRLVDRLIERGDALAAHPELGRSLPELPARAMLVTFPLRDPQGDPACVHG